MTPIQQRNMWAKIKAALKSAWTSLTGRPAGAPAQQAELAKLDTSNDAHSIEINLPDPEWSKGMPAPARIVG